MNKIQGLCAAMLAGACVAATAQSTAPSADGPRTTPFRFGFQFGTVQDHKDTEPVVQVSLGYEFNRNVSVEALASVSLLFMRMGGMEEGRREFDSAVGGRVLGTLPLGDSWNLSGGLGVVSFRDEVGNGTGNNDNHHRTSPMASVSAMYRARRHWGFGAEVSSFTAEHTLNAALRAEVHF